VSAAAARQEEPETPKVDPTDPAARRAFEERLARELAEAEAEKDPIKALGIDVTELAPADFEQHEIRTQPMGRITDAQSIARVWLTHSEVSTRYPKEDRVARSMARDAAAFWWKRKRTLRGLVLHRTFPCLGKFRVANEGAESGPIVVVCDRCGMCFGVDRDEFQTALDATLV
jgi:hypothetical protein